MKTNPLGKGGRSIGQVQLCLGVSGDSTRQSKGEVQTIWYQDEPNITSHRLRFSRSVRPYVTSKSCWLQRARTHHIKKAWIIWLDGLQTQGFANLSTQESSLQVCKVHQLAPPCATSPLLSRQPPSHHLQCYVPHLPTALLVPRNQVSYLGRFTVLLESSLIGIRFDRAELVLTLLVPQQCVE